MTVNMKSLQDHKIPGMSLTASPDQKLPFMRPPELVDKQQAMDAVWKQISAKENLPQLIKLLRQDIPVMDIAQVISKMGFAEGKWTPDLGIQMIEPAAYMIMHIARLAGVDYVFSRDIPDLNAYAHGENDDFLKKQMNSGKETGLFSDDETSEQTPDMEAPEGEGQGLMAGGDTEEQGGLMNG